MSVHIDIEANLFGIENEKEICKRPWPRELNCL